MCNRVSSQMSPFRFLLGVELGKIILDHTDNLTAQIVQLTVHTNGNEDCFIWFG